MNLNQKIQTKISDIDRYNNKFYRLDKLGQNYISHKSLINPSYTKDTFKLSSTQFKDKPSSSIIIKW